MYRIPTMKSYSSEDLSDLLGPVETQYCEDLNRLFYDTENVDLCFDLTDCEGITEENFQDITYRYRGIDDDENIDFQGEIDGSNAIFIGGNPEQICFPPNENFCQENGPFPYTIQVELKLDNQSIGQGETTLTEGECS